MNITQYYNLFKPQYEDQSDVAKLNANMDTIDYELKKRMVNPVGGMAGQILKLDSGGTPVWDDQLDPDEIVAATVDWLNEHASPDQTLYVDTSLTIAGAAADAKVVGRIRFARTLDSQDNTADLDVTDENGNVIARFKNGHFETKNFDSEDFDSIPETVETVAEEWEEFSAKFGIHGNGDTADLDISDRNGNVIVRFENGQIQTKFFNSAEFDGIPDRVDDLSDSIRYTVPIRLTSDESEPDLDITDSGGNVIARFIGGHIQTKHFNSMTSQTQLRTTDASADQFDITDSNGNVAMSIQNGYIKTKNFDSSKTPGHVRTTDAPDNDFDFVDQYGNVIMRLHDGYVKTGKFDSTNRFEVPSYYFPYLDEKCQTIHDHMFACGGDAFMFITDQHVDNNNGTANAHQSFKLIRYIHEKCGVNKLFMGGDLCNGPEEVYSSEFRDAIDGRMYSCCGNHDYYATGATEEKLHYTLRSGLDDENGNWQRRYFYIDNKTNKIRYIVVNTFKEGNNIWDWGLEQAQYDWLDDAMDVESGWTIIIFTHMLYGVNTSTMQLEQESRHSNFLTHLDNYSGNGIIAGVFVGHTHIDAITQSTGGIPVIVTGADKYQSWGTSEPWMEGRILGTITEQCFEVCIVDQVARKLRVVRIGGFTTGNDEEDAQLYEAGERVVDY